MHVVELYFVELYLNSVKCNQSRHSNFENENSQTTIYCEHRSLGLAL